MTDEAIEIEFEADLAWKGEKIKECPQCGWKTHRDQCEYCMVGDQPQVLTGDRKSDDVAARMMAGEKIDLNAAFEKDEFEPVKIGQK